MFTIPYYDGNWKGTASAAAVAVAAAAAAARHITHPLTITSIWEEANLNFERLLYIMCVQVDWFGLVSLFNGISTFVVYLMPKLLFQRIDVLLSNPWLGRLKGFIHFPKVLVQKWMK